MRRLLGSLVLPLVPTLLAVPPGPASGAEEVGPAATQVEIEVPTITWEPCRREVGRASYRRDAECAVVELPLDYDDPAGPTTPVHLLRMPATGQRIGSLFVNPGGPGGSAVDFAQYAGSLIGPGVARHFDVVGVDPRGIGSPPFALCRYPSGDEPPRVRVPYPLTRDQAARRIHADRVLDRACAGDRSPIVDHMSTADYVRDIDVVRQALGDEQLTYYGISYGSLVGQTYAAMFPDRVRAIIVDGVLDPIEWTTGRDPSLPSTYRLGSGKGAYEALTSALTACDRVGPERCVLAGHAQQAWLRAYRLAVRGALRADDHRIAPQELVQTALSALYDAGAIREWLLPFLRHVLRSSGASGRVSGSDWAHLVRIREQREAAGPYTFVPARQRAAAYGRRDVGFESVLCSDAVNPRDPWAWQRASLRADRKQPWFGRFWTWAGSLCARWPGTGGEDAFRGPWRTTTSTPLLVVGNTHDPATPISGARTANRQFAGSVLLTLDGWGHGALASGDCIAKRMAAYLIEQRLPGPSVYCRPDRPLFP